MLVKKSYQEIAKGQYYEYLPEIVRKWQQVKGRLAPGVLGQIDECLKKY